MMLLPLFHRPPISFYFVDFSGQQQQMVFESQSSIISHNYVAGLLNFHQFANAALAK